MKKKRITVLGYFGYINNQLDGQTVKTRDIFRLLNEQQVGDIDFFDTQQFQIQKLSLLAMIWKVCRCQTLIYLPAHNNLKYIFPLIWFLSILFRFDIQYFVVGGWLSVYIKKLPIHSWMLRHIKGIHVETKRLKNDLEQSYGYQNVDIFPNFRFFDFTPARSKSPTLRLVFMARISKMKGIDWIFNLAEYVTECNLDNKVSITFFGPIIQEDREYFLSSIARYSFITYKGILQPEDIYWTLSQYDVMLLPTHYFTEGLPGSIVDSFISGVPVIATEWIYAHEFIDDGINGFIIPFENGQRELVEKVVYLMHNANALAAMQRNALQKRNAFAPPRVFI